MLPINPFIGPAATNPRPRTARRAQTLTQDAAVAPDESAQAVESSDALYAPSDGGQGNPQQQPRRQPPKPAAAPDRLDLTA